MLNRSMKWQFSGLLSVLPGFRIAMIFAQLSREWLLPVSRNSVDNIARHFFAMAPH